MVNNVDGSTYYIQGGPKVHMNVRSYREFDADQKRFNKHRSENTLFQS